MAPLVSKIAGVALLLGTTLLVDPAQAEQSANELLRIYSAANASEQQSIEEMLRATENGMGWFSTAAKVTLYCEPKNLVLTGSQIIDILRRQIAETPTIGTRPYGLAIILALKQTFPCPTIDKP